MYKCICSMYARVCGYTYAHTHTHTHTHTWLRWKTPDATAQAADAIHTCRAQQLFPESSPRAGDGRFAHLPLCSGGHLQSLAAPFAPPSPSLSLSPPQQRRVPRTSESVARNNKGHVACTMVYVYCLYTHTSTHTQHMLPLFCPPQSGVLWHTHTHTHATHTQMCAASPSCWRCC